jgi:hypothetical protein
MMLLRYALVAAVALGADGIAEVRAQSPFPPVGQEQQSPFPPVGQQQQSPFPPPGQPSLPGYGQQQQMPPCFQEFIPLRQDVDKRFEAAKAGIEKRIGAAEMCNLLTKFSQAEGTLIKFIEKNAPTCPFPANMLQSVKASNAKTEGYRKQACNAAAAPARPMRPAEPTLSDALSPPIVGKDNTKTGSGTLDSLSGNPLAR